MPKKSTHAEVDLSDGSVAVVEGKTAVPFATFVTLILQRKVSPLCKSRGKDDVIVDSELLTDLASAPADSVENRNKLILVTLGVGILFGVFAFSLLQLLLLTKGTVLTKHDFTIIVSALVGLWLLTAILQRLQRGKKRGVKIAEKMERLTEMLSRK